MIQILATLGIILLIAGCTEAECEGRNIRPVFTVTGFLKGCFFIYLVYNWLGKFM